MGLKLHNKQPSLRDITKRDEEMLNCIYSATRAKEMEHVSHWTAEQKTAFLTAQFNAQHSYYQKNYAAAHFWMVEMEHEPIGRLYLHPNYQGKSVRIIDISLLPEWWNKGIGRQLLMDIMEYAREANRTVTIHVECFNPAMNLYRNLGFRLVSETNGVYHLLEWNSKATVAI